MEESYQDHDFKIIIDRAPDSILFVNSDGLIKFVNKRVEIDFGYKSEELLNQKIEILMPDRFRMKHFSYRSEYLKDPRSRTLETATDLYGLRKNGEEFPIDVSISPLYTSSGNLFIIAAIRDITEKKILFEELIKAKEKAEESNRLKSAFLATISHELKTPLNHILGFSGIISEMSEDESIKEFSGFIHESCINLINIVEDIFQLALVEKSEITIRENGIYISDLFIELKNELQETLSESEKSNAIELEYKIDSSIITKRIVTDKSKVRQVMSHLIKNAVKFTSEGTIELEVKLLNKEILSFMIKDTGIGIPKEKQQIVFEFFRQGDDVYTREHGGIGIGLAISQKIVKAMNGEIIVESEPGKGSVFTFMLPVKFTEEEKTHISTDTLGAKLPDLAGKKILIAENDEISSDMISRMLLPTRCKILKATNGKESIEVVTKAQDIHLILMDFKMSVMDGFRATKEIRKVRKDIPIIALTDSCLQKDKEKALIAGCNDVITKPVNKSLMYKILFMYIPGIKKYISQ
jgi:two-component system sensor histidine kinase/response regulator